MSQKNTGGPAFPVIPPANENGYSPSGFPYPDAGMTLRDYFAGQALVEYAGLMSVSMPETMNVVAKLSYQMADAMIEARNK